MSATILAVLNASRLLPVVVLDTERQADTLAEALLTGGLPLAEVTLRTTAGLAAIRRLTDLHPGISVGAGTVITTEQVDRAADAGATFIVSPGFDPAVVDRTLERGLLPLPGTATATEIQYALAAGLQTVKLFPAGTLGGPDTINAFSAPFPQVRFVPSGGITLHNASAYLAHPSVLAVGGSWMVPRSLLASGDIGSLRELVAASSTAIGRVNV